MLKADDVIELVEYDDELEVVVVGLARVNYEEKLSKKTRTSGCAVGTVFGDMMEGLDQVELASTPLHTSWIYHLSSLINGPEFVFGDGRDPWDRIVRKVINRWCIWRTSGAIALSIKYLAGCISRRDA